MSEEPLDDKSEIHRTKFLGPAGHLHHAAGYVEKSEQFLLTNMLTYGNLVKRGNERITKLSKKDTSGKTMDEIIGEEMINYALTYNSKSGGIKGFRSKQFTRVGTAKGMGAITPESLDPKRSLLDKLRGKNKPDESP